MNNPLYKQLVFVCKAALVHANGKLTLPADVTIANRDVSYCKRLYMSIGCH